MKSILSKLVKSDMAKSTDPKIANQLIASRNQTFAKVLDNIVPSVSMELKSSFAKLKVYLQEQKSLKNKRETGVKIVCGVEFKKMKEVFTLLCEWTNTKHQVKLWKLNRTSEINFSYKKVLLREAWTKLISNHVKQLGSEVKARLPKQTPVKPSENKAPL